MSLYGSTKNEDAKYASGCSSTALTAVALQDHWMRNLSLTDPLLVNRHKVPKCKAKQWSKDAKAVVDTGRANLKEKKKISREKEYVLDPRPPAPTLAQKFGLVEAPPQSLTEDEWQKAKEKSNKRDDSKQPCVICKEDFGFQEQVLLSCTHVFHRACLQAFERFTGKKTCPMCRRDQYQTRVIHEGAKLHRHTCATKIQALWRGHVVRRWYKKLRETNPPKDPKLRKKFYQQKLTSITDRMIRSLDCDVGGFLSEIDANIQASRDVMRQFEQAIQRISDDDWECIQLKAVERGNLDCPICLTLLEEDGLVTEVNNSDCTKVENQLEEELKATVQNKYVKSPLVPAKTTGSQKHMKPKLLPQIKPKSSRAKMSTMLTSRSNVNGYSNSANKNDCDQQTVKIPSRKSKTKRCSILLSCSHVFHQTCLEAFEEFAVGERRHLCPVCRAHYQKKIL